MVASEAQRRADLKYKKEKVKRIAVDLYQTDQDIIDWLETITEAKQSYIKRLIREDKANKTN